MSDLFGNPEDRFSRVAAQMVLACALTCTCLQILSRIHKACKNYDKWKTSHNPNFKPWIYPEQMTLPRLDMSQIQPLAAGVSTNSIDESNVGEEDIDDDDY